MGGKTLGFFSFSLLLFLARSVAGCGAVSSFERMCDGMIRVCVCVLVLMFPVFVVKLWVFLPTTAVMWHWVFTDSLSCCHVLTDPYIIFFKDTTLLLLYVEEITPSLSLYLVFPFSFSARISVNPPLLLLLSMRPLCSAFHSWTEGLYIPHSHWLSLTTWSQVGCPALKSSQLSGCSHGITLQLQWEESGGREGDRERERRQAQNGHG